MGHSYRTLLRDTLAGHSCGILMPLVGQNLRDTLVGDSCRTLLQGTLVGQSCGTLLSDTLLGHSCGTLLWDTLVGRSCGSLLQDLTKRCACAVKSSSTFQHLTFPHVSLSDTNLTRRASVPMTPKPSPDGSGLSVLTRTARSVADGCEQLTTVANAETTSREEGSARLYPRVKREPFAKHSGKRRGQEEDNKNTTGGHRVHRRCQAGHKRRRTRRPTGGHPGSRGQRRPEDNKRQ